MGTQVEELARIEGWSDEAIVERVRNGEAGLYEIIVRRYNQRLYRVARAILRDEAEAEDVMQDAYVRAYEHLEQFEGRAPFAAWLTRITVHEALARTRKRTRLQPLDEFSDNTEMETTVSENLLNPEQEASKVEMGRILEQELLLLPEQFRVVVMMRDVEDLSTAETADALGLTEENVKVRLHRGRMMMRRRILEKLGTGAREAFPFMGARCDRVTAATMQRVSRGQASS